MRGEQGLVCFMLKTVADEISSLTKGVYRGHDGSESLTYKWQKGFLLFQLKLGPFHILQPPYGLTFYGEAPQLFLPLIMLLVSLSLSWY